MSSSGGRNFDEEEVERDDENTLIVHDKGSAMAYAAGFGELFDALGRVGVVYPSTNSNVDRIWLTSSSKPKLPGSIVPSTISTIIFLSVD